MMEKTKSNSPPIAIALLLIFLPISGYSESNSESFKEFRREGEQLAMQMQAALGSNLKRALQKGGPRHAAAFCYERAILLTEETSLGLANEIVRISDKPRNPSNAANQDQLAILEQLRSALVSGKQSSSIVREVGDRWVGYYPIITNAMCLQCHGSVERDIDPETYAVIRAAYPSDAAVGYGINMLRGMFVVTMDATK